MICPSPILAPSRSLCHASFGGVGTHRPTSGGGGRFAFTRSGRRVMGGEKINHGPTRTRGSEKIAVRASAGQFKDENVLVNLVDEQPVGRDMAFAVVGPVVAEGVVAVRGRQWFASCKFADDVIVLRDVKTTAYRKPVVPFEPASPVNGVLLGRRRWRGFGGLFHRLSSSSASDSVYRGRVGSCAMRSPSSIAAMVSAFGTWVPSMMKGIRFSRTIVLIYTLITDEAESPTSLQKSTKRFLVGASSENVIFAMVFLRSFESKTRISYTKLTGLVKEAA